MDIKVISEKKNPMLERREIVFKVTYDEATPSRKSIVDKLAATMNSKQGLVIVDNIKTEFGKREGIGYAKIYENADRVKQVERPHIIERNIFNKTKGEGAAAATPEESKKEAS
ncbi:MAG: 30S ribosomal protein S24e [Methanotrichaceae archaeon]